MVVLYDNKLMVANGYSLPTFQIEAIVNRELFEQGLATRKEVLGEDYVQKSLKSADEFKLPMQGLVTQYCWGDLWNRPELSRKTRSLLNLAMLTALNRPHELKAPRSRRG